MQKPNCKCLTCGTEYYFCRTCRNKEPAWKADYCSENCKTVFETVSSFTCGSLTKDEAKANLSECDVKQLRPTVKEVVDTIYGKKTQKEEPSEKDPEVSKGLMTPSAEEKDTE